MITLLNRFTHVRPRQIRRAVPLLMTALLLLQIYFAAPTEARLVSFYVSPTYGYSLAFDPTLWWTTTDTTEDGYDLLVVTNGVSEVVLEGARNGAIDARSCVYDEMDRLVQRDDVAELTLAFEQPAWAGDFSGYLLGYSYIQHADSTDMRAAAAIKWCGLITDGASLVITQISPQAVIDAESVAIGELLQGLST